MQMSALRITFVVSHPSRKNKNAAKVGHPDICYVVRGVGTIPA
jgi:hypothetical protein